MLVLRDLRITRASKPPLGGREGEREQLCRGTWMENRPRRLPSTSSREKGKRNNRGIIEGASFRIDGSMERFIN